MDFYYSDFSMMNNFFFPWLLVGFLFYFIFISFFCTGVKTFFLDIFYLNGWVGGLSRYFWFYFMVVACFSVILLGNLLGLLPYVFSLTSHMVFNLCISFVFWLSIVMVFFSYDFVGYLSHQTPLGSPLGLSFALNLVELISNMIRPFTLSLRLSVKMSTGHVFIYLLSNGCMSSFWLIIFGSFLLSFYMLFEIAMCFVQGFVFSLLLAQYSDEI